MLTLLEFLKIHKEQQILKISFRLIAILIPLVALWAWPWLDKNVLQKVPHKILWSIFVILIAIFLILWSYIKYIYRELKIESIIKNYDFQNKLGVYKHKQIDEVICTYCLFEKQQKIPLKAKLENRFECIVCEKKYSEDKPLNLDLDSNRGTSLLDMDF